jgi:hypothetical protein
MKHIILIIVFSLLGFLPKSMAQTDHVIKLSYKKACFEKNFTTKYAITSDSIVPTFFLTKKLQDLVVPEGKYLHLKFEFIPSTASIMNGISTLDLVLLTKHLIRTQEITDPRGLFALDINNSGDVTVSDIIEMRALLYGLQINFKNNQSWRPFSSEQKKGNKNDIFTFLIDKDTTLNFEAVKIGDANGNASCN